MAISYGMLFSLVPSNKHQYESGKPLEPSEPQFRQFRDNSQGANKIINFYFTILNLTLLTGALTGYVTELRILWRPPIPGQSNLRMRGQKNSALIALVGRKQLEKPSA
jgi:hypothetical protein